MQEADPLIINPMFHGHVDQKDRSLQKHAHNHKKKRNSIKLVEPPKESCCDMKLVSFVIIGGITLIYCVAELAAAIWLDSLTLLSDGFHNLSDVISLYIAFWAVRATKRESSDSMSYGWARAEILGGLTNGCFLLSLCLYVVLESIPRFIKPQELDAGYPFIAIAAAGLLVNTVGTLVFAATGLSHGHSHAGGGGHGHSHGGGGHSHAGHGEKKKKKHGHSHGDKKKKKHGHDHDEEEGFALDNHGEEHGHSHAHGKKEKKEKHGHSHGGGGHGHSHGDKKKKKHGHAHEEEKGYSWNLDLNMWGVFIHYAGDMVSSGVVLASGLLIKFVGGTWTEYIDPVSSLIIVVLILWTTVPLLKECSMILLQSTPSMVELGLIRKEIEEMQGVESVHDLHVWQLAEGKVVGSVHISVEEGMDFKAFIKNVKEVFHEHGIHSSTIQPEFVPKNHPASNFCAENCVKDCEEDWCCKKTADKQKLLAALASQHVSDESDDEAGTFQQTHHGGSSGPSFY